MTEIKTGFMHKCGKSFKSWKRRWFVLKANGYLYYYENKSSTNEKGKIDIVDAQRIATWFDISTAERKLPNGLSPDRALAIVCRDRTYTCVCEIDGESQSWINALNKLKGSEEQQYPPPTNPKEASTSKEQPATKFEAPPPYTPTANPPPAASPASPMGASGPQMPQPHNYGGLPPPIGVNPGQPYQHGSGTLPRPSAGPPPPQPFLRSNSFNPPTSSPTRGPVAPPRPAVGVRPPPPPGGPGYTQGYPAGNYQQPRPPPPTNPAYYPPRAPAGYPPRPAYYPPAAQPPPAAAYPPRPPPSAYPPRPYPATYRPPPAPYRPPGGGYQVRPPPPQQYRPAPVQQQAMTNVTVINLAAPTTRVVYR